MKAHTLSQEPLEVGKQYLLGTPTSGHLHKATLLEISEKVLVSYLYNHHGFQRGTIDAYEDVGTATIVFKFIDLIR